jgi:hypothetical protein
VNASPLYSTSVGVPNAAVALRELLAWAAANDLGDLDDLTVATPTLEDAYLRLVDGGTR